MFGGTAHHPPVEQLLEAIAQNDFEVTAQQVLTHLNQRNATGSYDLGQVEEALAELLSTLNGSYEMTENNAILYKFPRSKNLRLQLYQSDFKFKIQDTLWNVVAPVAFYCIRIFFGCLLLLSLLIASIGILVVLLSKNNSNRMRLPTIAGHHGHLNVRGVYYFYTFWWIIRHNPFFRFNYGNRIPASVRSRRRIIVNGRLHELNNAGYFRPLSNVAASTERRSNGNDAHIVSTGDRDTSKASEFVEAVFSFMFGDGSPGPTTFEKWSVLIKVITKYDCCLPGELLEPYLDSSMVDRLDDRQHHGYMVDVLNRFKGKVVSTDDGQLLYVFPMFLDENNNCSNTVISNEYLIESKWQFSKFSREQIQQCIGIGVANILLLAIMYRYLSDIYTYDDRINMRVFNQYRKPSQLILGFIHKIFNVLFVYAILYLLIPLIRFFFIQLLNQSVQLRNESRKQLSVTIKKQLSNCESPLYKKLQSSKRINLTLL